MTNVWHISSDPATGLPQGQSQCGVCEEVPKDPVVCPCEHCFCSGCISNACQTCAKCGKRSRSCLFPRQHQDNGQSSVCELTPCIVYPVDRDAGYMSQGHIGGIAPFGQNQTAGIHTVTAQNGSCVNAPTMAGCHITGSVTINNETNFKGNSSGLSCCSYRIKKYV